ncbi:MAG: hypothetical protein Q9219_001139 [cf. Caloplaca sp. 3 TL-2023]
MSKVQYNQHKKHFWIWYEAMEAKFKSKGEPYSAADIDQLLEDYSAVTDIPCVLFTDELLARFPDAKVILTNRDIDRWLMSMEKIYSIMGWKSMWALAQIDPNIFKYLDLLKMALTAWTGGDWENREKLREGYRRHYQHVRSSVPEERLLEFRSEDGWEPLCNFLNKPVPSEPYPCVNVGNELYHMHYVVIVFSFISTVLRGLKWLAPVGVVLLGVWYMGYRPMI